MALPGGGTDRIGSSTPGLTSWANIGLPCRNCFALRAALLHCSASAASGYNTWTMEIVQRNEAAPYYFKYIDRISSDDIVSAIGGQLEETIPFLRGISEEQSLHRYAAGKWSIRQVLNHVNDTEQVFLFRAFWFARGFAGPLPSFEQDISAVAARADEFSWASHIEAFQGIRGATLAFFRNLPLEAWARSGVASGSQVTVKALAYIVAGHLAHHRAVLEERYL